MSLRDVAASGALLLALTSAFAAAQTPTGQPGPYPQPAAADASMRLQVKPRDTQVFVDGYYAGIVDNFDGTFQRLHLEAGEHRVELYLPGHRIYAQDLYLQPGNTFTVRHTMEPLGAGEPEPERPTGASRAARPPRAPGTGAGGPSPPSPGVADPGADSNAAGTIAIRVQPTGAVILLDGEPWTGPADGDALEIHVPPGTHTVEARKPGFRDYLTEVTVRSGETTPLNVSLTPGR